MPFALPSSVFGLEVPLTLSPDRLRAALCDLLQPLPGASPAIVSGPGVAGCYDDLAPDSAPRELHKASMTSVLAVARGLSTFLVEGEVSYVPAAWTSSASVPLPDAVRLLAMLARPDWAMLRPPPPSGGSSTYGANADHDYFSSVHPLATLTEAAVVRGILRGAEVARRAASAVAPDGRPVTLMFSHGGDGGGTTSVEGAATAAIPNLRCGAARRAVLFPRPNTSSSPLRSGGHAPSIRDTDENDDGSDDGLSEADDTAPRDFVR